MMSSARDHHEKAEQLLSAAGKEPNSISRSLLLAEAQVHATLALSAPAESMPGQDEARGTESTAVAPPGMPGDSGQFLMQPHGSSGGPGRGEGGLRERDQPPETAPGKRIGRGQLPEVPLRYSASGPLPGTAIPPRYKEDSYPGKRRPENQRPEQERDPARKQEPGPGEQEPGPAGQSPDPGNPDDQKPGDFTF
jgi:hypothetical protein